MADKVLVDVPSAVIEVGTAVTVTAAALPTVNFTSAEPLPVPALASTVAEPAVVALVSTTVATPLALVVVEALAKLPAEVFQVTGVPATRLPWASLTVADKVLVDVPSAVIEVGTAVTVTAAALPTVNFTTAESLPAPALASTVAEPAVVALDSTTVATPLESVEVAALASVPAEVFQATDVPATRLPWASLTVADKVLVDVPLAVMVSGATAKVRAAALPTVNVTAAESLPVPALASTVAEPAVVELVSTTVATPLVLVVVEALAKLPAEVVQATGVPATRLPWASLTVADKVLVDVPSAVMEAGAAVTATSAALSATNATLAVAVPATAFAVITALPMLSGAVRITVALLSASVTVEEPPKAPLVVDHCTGIPAPRKFPFLSATVATSVLVATPSAKIVAGFAVRLTIFAVLGSPRNSASAEAMAPCGSFAETRTELVARLVSFKFALPCLLVLASFDTTVAAPEIDQTISVLARGSPVGSCNDAVNITSSLPSALAKALERSREIRKGVTMTCMTLDFTACP